MSELTKETCAFALDGTCRLPPEKCAVCKVDKATSDFHGNLCIGAYTWAQVQRMCGGKMTDDRKRARREKGGKHGA